METPTSVLKHSDPSKSKYGPDPSKTIYGPSTNYWSGSKSYYRTSPSSNDFHSRNRNDQNRGANKRFDHNNRSRNYVRESHKNNRNRSNVSPAYTETSPGFCADATGDPPGKRKKTVDLTKDDLRKDNKLGWGKPSKANQVGWGKEATSTPGVWESPSAENVCDV